MKAKSQKACRTVACAVVGMLGLGAWADDAALPVATVTELSAAELAQWNSVGIPITDISGAFSSGTTGNGWSYTPYVCNYKADVGFIFKADPNEVKTDYDGWYVDYVVSVDKAVAKESFGLVGAYQKWGSLGFFAPVEIPANRKVPLLNSVMKISNWTYAQIRSGVVSFTCGAFNLAQANVGTKLTVELRIFHPDCDTDTIRDFQNWDDDKKTSMSKLIYAKEWTIGAPGQLPSGEGHGPLQVQGVGKTIPANMFYLDNTTRLFVKAASEITGLENTTAYFTEEHTVANIGNVGYVSLAAAMEAAESGDTIVLTEGNAETIVATTTKIFMVDPNGKEFTAQVTPATGCEFVQTADGLYAYRMKTSINELSDLIIVQTESTDKNQKSAAVTIPEEKVYDVFRDAEAGAKRVQIKTAGIGTVTFDTTAVQKINENIDETVVAAGGGEEGAKSDTTVTVALEDVTQKTIAQAEAPTIIVKDNLTNEVVQAIEVTAILRTIIKQSGSTTAVTNDEVYSEGKALGSAEVEIPYVGISPTVWYFDSEAGTTNYIDSTYQGGYLKFVLEHFSDYLVADVPPVAKIGSNCYTSLQAAFDAIASGAASGTIVLNQNVALTNAVVAAAGKTYSLDLGNKQVTWDASATDAEKAKGLIQNKGTLTVFGARSELRPGKDNYFMTCDGDDATTTIKGGIYYGQFPAPADPAVTNAGPFLVASTSASFVDLSAAIPFAYCAETYVPNPNPKDSAWHVMSVNVYIRDISACQRYPWNGFVDITFDVCWDEYKKAKLFVSAWDMENPLNPQRLNMTMATLITNGVSQTVNCKKGFVVEAEAEKNLHLIWNSTEGVDNTRKDKVGFRFIAK